MKIINLIRDAVDSIIVAYMKQRVLSRKLDSLTDPTFLDRATAGEKEE